MLKGRILSLFQVRTEALLNEYHKDTHTVYSKVWYYMIFLVMFKIYFIYVYVCVCECVTSECQLRSEEDVVSP